MVGSLFANKLTSNKNAEISLNDIPDETSPTIGDSMVVRRAHFSKIHTRAAHLEAGGSLIDGFLVGSCSLFGLVGWKFINQLMKSLASICDIGLSKRLKDTYVVYLMR